MIAALPRYRAKAGPACSQQVVATPEATDAIRRLAARQGRITLHHVGGAVGTVAYRRARRPVHAERHEACIGNIGGVPFFVDYDRDAELGYPDFVVDVDPAWRRRGAGEPRFVSRAVPQGSTRR